MIMNKVPTVMFDSVVPDHLPRDAKHVAGYVDGEWPTYDYLRKHWPHAHVTSIATWKTFTADVLDVEKGNAMPFEAPEWVVAMRKLGKRPIIYCSRSNMDAVLHAFKATNVPVPFFWIADFTNKPHLVEGSIATQWADGSVYPGLAAGCDTSIVSPNFPYPKKRIVLPITFKRK